MNIGLLLLKYGREVLGRENNLNKKKKKKSNLKIFDI